MSESQSQDADADQPSNPILDSEEPEDQDTVNSAEISANTSASYTPIHTVRASDATAQSQYSPQVVVEKGKAQDMRYVRLAATQLVNWALDQAVDECVAAGCERPLPVKLLLFQNERSEDREMYYDMSFERAVITKAIEQLHAFIGRWLLRRHPHPLMWCIKMKRHWHCKTLHSFVMEAKFSAPTPDNPVPQSTANVYFWFEVHDFDWPLVPSVEVPFCYQFEGMVYMHPPVNFGHGLEFQETLLYNILAEKSKLFEQLHF